MALTIGSRLGPYEITATLGAGGMGEVYRARDTRLGRDVALKILPDVFASDADRLARFTREAQILASMSHPHIGAIFGIEDAPPATPGQPASSALVLELVEGPTLADRIAEGAVPVDEALAIARQIADALEAAHEQAVIHRDLKPANIKVRPDGTVKVLDFGLAKALESAPSTTTALSPTITSPAITRAGFVLGTAAYLSPEQARGRPADKRTDVWSFGCVLYEMLTARRAFDGDNVSDSIAAVLRSEPSWVALPKTLPPSVAHVLKRCLEKDPKRRLHDMADVRILLDDAPPAGGPGERRAGRTPRAGTLAAGAVACLLAGAVAGVLVLWPRTDTSPPRVEWYDIATPPDATFTVDIPGTNVAIAPDGSELVYHVRTRNSPQLVRRRFDRLEQELIPGTDRAASPTFSPTGTQIAFARQGRLMRTTLGGSSPVPICDISGDFGGASWGDDNAIVFAEGGKGLFRVPSTGGTPENIAAPDVKKGERDYFSPQVLPGGKAVLFTVVPVEGTPNEARVVARRLATGETVALVEGATHARYVSTGHLLYSDRTSGLMAQPFNPDTLEKNGAPVQVLPGVQRKVSMLEGGQANYAVGADGSLLYATGGNAAEQRRLIWVNRKGDAVGRVFNQQLDYPRYPRLSPDGNRLAATLGPGNEGQIWIFDLRGGHQPIKLTFKGHNTFPAWDPTGRFIAFSSTQSGPRNVFQVPADGSILEPERLTTSSNLQIYPVWSPDRQVPLLMFSENSPVTRADLWVLSVDGKRVARPWLANEFVETEPAFSPDGKWVAFVSDQNGTPEVWIRPFPGPGPPVRVSDGGGRDPVWSRNGDELFYQTGTKLMAVEITETRGELQPTPPIELFDGGFVPYAPGTPRTYDVAEDGRFVMVEPSEDAPTPTLVVVRNWFEELKRLVPTTR
jgi:serine/threonine-protein kinase